MSYFTALRIKEDNGSGEHQMEKVPPAPLAEAGLTKFYLGQCIIELLQYFPGGQ